LFTTLFDKCVVLLGYIRKIFLDIIKSLAFKLFKNEVLFTSFKFLCMLFKNETPFSFILLFFEKNALGFLCFRFLCFLCNKLLGLFFLLINERFGFSKRTLYNIVFKSTVNSKDFTKFLYNISLLGVFSSFLDNGFWNMPFNIFFNEK
jgi:hypothetical protein